MIKHTTLSLLAVAALQSVTLHSAVAQTGATPLPEGGTYYQVTRQDTRKCAYPLCGGYFVKAVNQLLTRCADGSWQKDCHAVSLDASALGWSDDQRATFDTSFSQGQALVRGSLGRSPVQSLEANVLTITQAWQGQTLNKPAGTFYGVKSTGIVCITTPCPSLEASRLNSLSKPTNPDLDLSATGATDEQLQSAYAALDGSGILTVGKMTLVRYPTLTGGSRLGTKLVASEFYLPAKP